ncbi:MAG: alpha/beta hydrolase family protein [Armatimonadota bacterium]|jgi:dienelactone hydrolase
MDPAVNHRHTDAIIAHLDRLYDPTLREFACLAESPEQVAAWQERARPALRELLGLTRMERELAEHSPTVTLDEPEQLDGFTRRLGRIETEPGWPVEFWLLRPDGEGPFPLAVMPHGHEPRGHDTYAGVDGGEERRIRKIAELDADVAVQAVERGFLAISVNTRGFEANCVPDLNERHDGRDCHSELIHALLAGRTAIGERAWDLERVIDWAVELPEVDASDVLMMGNSGGGMATTYAAACDTRVTIAIASCSFATFVGANGLAYHCDCNVVPGIYRFGEFSDVAGLTAPRHLLLVNGGEDPLFPRDEVERATSGVEDVYDAAGVPGRFEHRWGPEGHRFYADLMWPWVEKALSAADEDCR